MLRRIFERYELEAFLGEFIGEFDIEAIIDEATELFHGIRFWREGIDLSEICQRHVKEGMKMNNNEQLFKILTHAQVNAVKSLRYFEYSQEKEKEGNTEIANNYWSTCQDYNGRARGLLEAYKIMTGKSILPIPSHINDEMLIVQDDILKEPLMEKRDTELIPF